MMARHGGFVGTRLNCLLRRALPKVVAKRPQDACGQARCPGDAKVEGGQRLASCKPCAVVDSKEGGVHNDSTDAKADQVLGTVGLLKEVQGTRNKEQKQ